MAFNPAEAEGALEDGVRDPAARVAALLEQDDLDGALALARSLHPADLADALSGIDADIRDLVVERCDPAEIAAALSYIEPHYREGLLVGLPVPHIADVLARVPDDVATDVVQQLPEEIAGRVVARLPEPARRAIGELLAHETETAGGRMTGQRVAVLPHRTVREVIAYLRTLRPDAGTPFYLYMIDAQGRLSGVLNLRALLTAPEHQRVSELADTDVISVHIAADQEETARLLKRYNLLALPVVDSEGKLRGTVTADDLLDVLEDEATEDMFRIVGVDEEEDLRGVLRSVRFRLPWLTVNLGTVLLAAFVVSLFEGTLERVAVLAAFIPVIGGMGGNAGIQTLTVVVRSLALGRLTPRNTRRVIQHELGVGVVVGVSVGAAIAVVAWLWQGNGWLGAVVGVALIGNVLVGVTAGTLIPMGLDRMKQDPALSAGIWLTTATDVLGFLGFLGLATLLIGRID